MLHIKVPEIYSGNASIYKPEGKLQSRERGKHIGDHSCSSSQVENWTWGTYAADNQYAGIVLYKRFPECLSTADAFIKSTSCSVDNPRNN